LGTFNSPSMGDQREQAVAAVEYMNNFLTQACNASMPPKRPGPPGHQQAYWWTEDIAGRRRTVFSLRRDYRAILRRSGPLASNNARLAFALARNELRSAIRNSKESSWRDLCS